MTNWRFPQEDGHTPLSEEDRQGLLLSHIATRNDLNDAEQRNIAKALRRRAPTVDRLLDDMYLRGLHKAMFGVHRIDRQQEGQGLTGVCRCIGRTGRTKARSLVERYRRGVRRKHIERDGFKPEISGPGETGRKQLLSIPPTTEARGYPHAPDDRLRLDWAPADAHHRLGTTIDIDHEDRTRSACERRKPTAPGRVIERGLALVTRFERSTVALKRSQPNRSVDVYLRRSQLPHDHASQSTEPPGHHPSRFRRTPADADHEFAAAARDALDRMNSLLNAAIAAHIFD